MAKQRGIFKFEGPMGDRSYYMRDGKYYVRRKTRHKVDTDPRFEKTHRKGLDFGTASRASKLLREALGHTVKPFSDTYMAGRMTARFVQAVAADQLHECGQRQVSAGNLSTLKGFEFNKHVSSLTLGLFPAVSIDSTKGKIKIALSPATMPQDISDAQLTIGITVINFQKGTYTPHNSIYPLSTAAPTEFNLSVPANVGPEAAIIVTLRITYIGAGERGQAMIVADVFTAAGIKPQTCTTKMKHAEKVVRLNSRPPGSRLWTPLPQRLSPKPARRYLNLPMKRMNKRRRRIIPDHKRNIFDRQLRFSQQLFRFIHP